jgi:hypothetical protein
MKHNVGQADHAMRGVLGPALLALGYTTLNSREGEAVGVVAMAAGAIITGTAITRFCPINAVLGIDTSPSR